LATQLFYILYFSVLMCNFGVVESDLFRDAHVTSRSVKTMCRLKLFIRPSLFTVFIAIFDVTATYPKHRNSRMEAIAHKISEIKVLTATSTKMAVFWDIADIVSSLSTDASITYQTTRCYILQKGTFIFIFQGSLTQKLERIN
jgi:hypothetical protein